ncbi:MAG: DMT family transporter [Halobacteria archaeon]
MKLRYRHLILFTVLSAVWGAAFTVVKALLPEVNAVALAAFRYDVAGLLMLAYIFLGPYQWRPRGVRNWRLVSVGGVFFIAAHFSFLFTGQRYVTSAVAAVGTGTIPLITPALAVFLLDREGLDMVGWIGIISGFVGVVVIAGPEPGNLLNASTVGMAFILMSSVWFSLGAVLTRRYRTDLSTPTHMTWSMLVGAVLLHLYLLTVPGISASAVEWSNSTVTGLIYLAVVAGAGGFLIYFYLLDEVGATEINLVDYVLPFFAALSGWILLGEGLRPATWLGFGFILLGFGLVKRHAIRQELG